MCWISEIEAAFYAVDIMFKEALYWVWPSKHTLCIRIDI